MVVMFIIQNKGSCSFSLLNVLSPVENNNDFSVLCSIDVSFYFLYLYETTHSFSERSVPFSDELAVMQNKFLRAIAGL